MFAMVLKKNKNGVFYILKNFKKSYVKRLTNKNHSDII